MPRKKENNTTPKKENNTTEPWGGATSVVSSNDDAWSAFETSSNLNVVSNNLDDSFDPFSAKNLAPVQGETFLKPVYLKGLVIYVQCNFKIHKPSTFLMKIKSGITNILFQFVRSKSPKKTFKRFLMMSFLEKNNHDFDLNSRFGVITKQC